ncbi:MAG: acyl-CoA thioesterase II [Flavobacteriaceae bacterium]
MKTLQELLDLLYLKKIDEKRYEGQNYMTPWGRVFGGQVLGQALNAAYQTVPEDRLAHSLHGYFILQGKLDLPVQYQVETLRDGKSFTTRRITALQENKAIFVMAVSFQKEQTGIDHQVEKPNVLPPEVLLPDQKQLEYLQKKSPELYTMLTAIRPEILEFRSVEHIDPTSHQPTRPERHVWFRINSAATQLTQAQQHQILAFASDYNLLITAVQPHRGKIKREQMFMASLDHAMWFHRSFSLDQWVLYAIESPSASNARGFANGKIFSQDGALIASVSQEGVIRTHQVN